MNMSNETFHKTPMFNLTVESDDGDSLVQLEDVLEKVLSPFNYGVTGFFYSKDKESGRYTAAYDIYYTLKHIHDVQSYNIDIVLDEIYAIMRYRNQNYKNHTMYEHLYEGFNLEIVPDYLPLETQKQFNQFILNELNTTYSDLRRTKSDFVVSSSAILTLKAEVETLRQTLQGLQVYLVESCNFPEIRDIVVDVCKNTDNEELLYGSTIYTVH